MNYTPTDTRSVAHFREDKIEELCGILTRHRGNTPNASLFHAAIELLCERGRTQDALRLLALMKDSTNPDNTPLTPFPATYTTLLLHTALLGDVDATFGLFAQMKREGAKASMGLGQVYQTLMRACEVAGDADRALATYSEVMRLGKQALMEGNPTPLSAPYPLSFLDSLMRTFKAAGREDEIENFSKKQRRHVTEINAKERLLGSSYL